MARRPAVDRAWPPFDDPATPSRRSAGREERSNEHSPPTEPGSAFSLCEVTARTGRSQAIPPPSDPLRSVHALAEVNQALAAGGPSDDLLGSVVGHVRRLVDAADAAVLPPDEMLPSGHAVLCDGGTSIQAPLRVRSRVVAVVRLQAGASDSFDEAALAAVRLFLAQVGLAVETRLSGGSALSDALSLSRGAKRTRRRLLHLAPSPVRTGEGLRQTLDRFTDTVVDLTPVAACTIQVLDPDLTLRTVSSVGLPEELLHGMDQASRAGVSSPALEAISLGVPVVVTNERARILANPLYNAGTGTGLGRWVAAGALPLTGRYGARGALSYFFCPDDPPSEADTELIRLVATQVAGTLDNAELLAASDERVAELEREHLARELHDSVSQALYAIALDARTVLDRVDHDPALAKDALEDLVRLTASAQAEMRAILLQLVPRALEVEGLAGALRAQAQAIRARHGLTVDVVVDNVPPSSADAHTAVYRIAQEALYNAARHARASRVSLRLTFDDDNLVLVVSDDGVGFDPDRPVPGHLGGHSRQARALAVGGFTRVESRPGAGTRVEAVVPRFPTGHSTAAS